MILREGIDQFFKELDFFEIGDGIERLFFLRNVTNGIDVAQARGVIVYTLATRGISLVEYTPLQVKSGIAGN